MLLIHNNNRFELQCNYDQRHIAKNAGCLWDNKYKTWWADNPKAIKCLQQYWDIDIEQYLNALTDKTEQQIKLSYANNSNIDIPSPSGLNYLGYQKAGIEYASSRDNCLIADEMGCLSGDTALNINRCRKGFKISLEELYLKTNNLNKGKKWDLSKQTKIRTLINNEFALYPIQKVIHQGHKNLLLITTLSGKQLKCTPDHEILTPSGFKAASLLKTNDQIIINGSNNILRKCLECGSTNNIIIYKDAKFKGYCKKCMYQKKRFNASFKIGKFIDCDGYVRVSGAFNHPRARNTYVYEHILVMEKIIGRYVDYPREHVHHINGIRSDNNSENLLLVTISEHNKQHNAKLRLTKNKFGQKIIWNPLMDKIIDIQQIPSENVYDIVMQDPHRHFVANGIVVSNCGKTIQAIGLINFLELKRILIICPASLKINWSRELEKWLRPYVQNNIVDKNYNRNGIIIMNYESVKKFKAEIHAKEWDLLICDESHYLKNPKSLRTKLIFGGSDYLPIPAKRKLFLTGTPILNRPIELWPLLKACGIVTDWRHFVTRYCDGKINFRGFWETKGATNVVELGELLRNKIMIRRLKKDVLPELPAKIRQVVTLEKSGKISKLIALENKALNDYNEKTKDIKAKISELKKQGRTGIKYQNQILALRECFADFQEIAKMRLNTAMLKTEQIATQTIDTVEQCGSAVVFAHHHAVISDILNRLWEKKIKAAAFTGKMTLEARQKVVDDFQEGKIDVFVGSIKAAGVGITLTRSSNVIFAELDWTPSSIAQAEDRCHRIGQNDSVLSRFMVFDESIDAMLAHKIIEKEEVIEGILI